MTNVGNITASGKATIQGDIVCGGEVAVIAGEGTPAGVTDYSALTGKPQINGVTLVSGNNTLAALGIQAAGDYATNSGVTTLLADYTTKTFVSNNYVGKSAFNAHTADSDIHITAAERTAWNAKWDYNEATIKAVKVTSASSADSVAWSGISGKPTTFTPSAHSHTASEISGLPTNLSAFTNDVGFVTVRQKNGYSYNNLNSLYVSNALIYRIDLTDVQVNIWTMLFIEVSLRQHHSLGYAGKILINLYHGSVSDFTAFNATILGNLNNINVYSSDRRYIYIYASMSHPTISVDRVLVGDNAINYDLSNITIEKVDSLPDTYQTATIYNGLHTGNFTKSLVEGVLTGDITSHTHTFASLTSKPTTIAGYGITDAYTATTIDNKLSGYLPLTGGTISNQLSIDYNSVYPLVLNGSENYSVIRFRARGTEASDMGWLNDYRGNLSYISNISNSGVISVNYDGVYYSDELTNFKKYTIIHTGNYNSYSPKLDGTGASGTWGINITGNAAKVGGFSVTSANSKPWGTIPAITAGGYMDVGKHFEFHYDNTTGSDYSTFLGCTGNYGNVVNLPSTSGTLALLTDNVASATKLQTPRNIWGKSFDGTSDVNGDAHITGNLIVDGEVSALVA